MKYTMLVLIPVCIIAFIGLFLFEEKMSFIDSWILYMLFYLTIKQIEEE